MSPSHILDSYGVNDEPTRPFAVNCLLARRMVEQGVPVHPAGTLQLGRPRADRQEVEKELRDYGSARGGLC